MKHLIFTDAHVAPLQDLKRFPALGNFIVEEKPDIILNLGDYVTLDSMSFYDKYKKTNLKDDIEVGREALSLMMEPIKKEQARLISNRQKRWNPKLVYVQGNHEYRLSRYVESNPELTGLITLPLALGFDDWRIVPYKQSITLNNIRYIHIPFSAAGKPIASVNIGRTVAWSAAAHTIFGHTHKLHYYSLPLQGDHNAVRIAVGLPCFLPQGHVEDYAMHSSTGWSYGVTTISPADMNNPLDDVSVKSVRQLIEQYSV